MSDRRLFSPVPLEPRTNVVLGGNEAHYAGKVLRLRKGDELTLFDGGGQEFPATITSVARDEVCLQLHDSMERNTESRLPMHLVQGVSRGERMDFVVQKATELGVSRITPVVCEFSVVKLDCDRARKRRAHWQRVAASACEQCGRNVLPNLDEPLPFADWLARFRESGGTGLLLDTHGRSLSQITRPEKNAVLLIGPEGGLSASEKNDAKATGLHAISLGPRVLRTETAAIAALAALQTLFGDFV